MQVKMASREYHVILDADTLLSKSAVLAQMSRQCSEPVFLASGVSAGDWQYLVDKAMEPLMEQYAENPSEKQPIRYIGLQAQLLPPKLSDLDPSKVRYFFNQQQGVLDAMGLPVENPNLVYDPSQMKGVQQIQYQGSGIQGFLKFLEEPLAPSSSDAYFEFVLTTVFPYLFGWSSPFNVKYLKKLPTLILEGEPGVRKTTRARIALAAGY